MNTYIVSHRYFRRVELSMIRPAAGFMYKSPGYTSHQQTIIDRELYDRI